MATVLVTGGSGFIGGWCVRAALDAGHSVRITVRDLSKPRPVENSIVDTAESILAGSGSR